MVDVIEIQGGDGVPPEPNWRTIFGRAADRDAAAAYWRDIISDLRSSEKLAVANAHSIKRLAVAYVMYDRSAKEVARTGPVMKAAKTKVPTYNPWWTTMSNADSQAAALEKAQVTDGPAAGEPFNPLEYHTFVGGNLFGWRTATNRWRYRTGWLETGKGQAKSPLMGAIGVYIMGWCDIPRAQCYAIGEDKAG